ncbi:UDP-N-acetylglucosamine--N-acetylmuramyl-(pentapeptide) pyrophosphoryl-undecaprenol N-acetylglucosamine transferase [Candidatus Babeliales bacterium]|nr:UDP-N-acetylglucosamine--N-acetylmuramyl-(pentapeptide) pyrophosphoryl-undecaprenol N-acetylglucosamine transferase [Candidatus Babeliales bacterium]
MSSVFLTTALTICFVAGKSGGHLLPCITQAKHIFDQNPQTELYVFTSGSELDKTILKKYHHIQEYVPTSLDNPPYSQPWLLPWFALKTTWYFFKSCYKLYQLKPAKVVSFGGFICIPTCLAAQILGIPFELYELNVEPGKATKFLSKLTKKVYTCFQSTQNYLPGIECIHFDYPIRFAQKDLQFDRLALLDQLHFQANRKTLLILGGSQGSILLNQVVKNMFAQHPQMVEHFQIIHQTGASDPYDYAAFYKNLKIPALVFGFHDKLQDFYNLADIILSRAGAGSLFEIKFFHKPCIVIPHETTNTNHQIKNVLELAKEFPDQFRIIKQSDFDENALFQTLKNNLF